MKILSILLLLCIVTLPVTDGLALNSVPQQNPSSINPLGVQGNVTIRGTLRGIARGAKLIGRLKQDTPLRLVVSFKFRAGTDPEGYVKSIYDTSSPNYQHYLTPQSFADLFAPSPTDYQLVVNWLRLKGFTITRTAPDRLMIEVSANSGRVEGAFNTTLSMYRFQNVTFYSSNTDPQLPASIGNFLGGIVGMHNYTSVRLMAHGFQSDPTYYPSDIRTAYDDTSLISNLGYDGTGQTIDILDFGDYPNLFSDLSSFDTHFSLPNPSVSKILMNNPSSCTGGTNYCIETAMDVQWAHVMAPGAALHVVLVPDLSDASLTAGIGYVVNTDLTSGGTFSNSWVGPEICSQMGNHFQNWPQSFVNAAHNLFVQAASEGISTFFSSGDNGASMSCGLGYDTIQTVEYPASDSFVTAVGGTSLNSINGPSESGWSGSGGGVGQYFLEPVYQSSDFALSGRGVPDVSMDADPSTGVYVYCNQGSSCSGSYTVGGTSLSAPLWAGSVAVLNHALGTKLGFLNPLVYAVYPTLEYSSDFHDITVGNNGYPAGSGWDMVTGLGTPDLFKMAQNRGMTKVSVNPNSITQGQTLGYSGSGFRPNAQVQVAIWNDGSGYVVGSPTATNSGSVSGSFLVGANILPGTRRVTFTDTSTNYVATTYVQVIELTLTSTQTVTTTSTSTSTSVTSSTLTSGTTTATTTTSTSTVPGQVCTITTTSTLTSVTLQVATTTSSTTSTTTTMTSTTSTFATTTAFTSTSTSVTVTTTTLAQCTQTMTATSTSTTTTTSLIPKATMTISYEIIGGGSPPAPSFNFIQGGLSKSYVLTGNHTPISVDAAGTWSVTPNPLAGSSSERWESNQPLSGSASDISLVFVFYHQYYLSTQASPLAGGSVSPGSEWLNSDEAVEIQATPAAGYNFFSWTGIGTDSYSGESNPVTITMNSPITETANFVLPGGVGDVASSIIGASAGSAWFVLPDYRGPMHSPAAKCGGVNSAELSDFSAGGYVLGLLSNPQNQLLDTNPAISLSSCGYPSGTSGTVVTLAGPGVNTVVHYYEQVADITPVYFLWDGSKNNFAVRYTGQRYVVPNPGSMTTAGDDLFLIETFTDGQGRRVLVLYGFSWQGTVAAGVFYASYVYPQLSQFPNSWYIYRWTDVGGNTFPDSGDSFTLLASSGPAPVLTSTSVPPSGGSYSGFAGIQQDVLGASKDSVVFILPDYVGPMHSSKTKCNGRSAAALSDYSAGGYLLSATSNYQSQILDTDGSVNLGSGSCGQFSGSSSVLVGMAGPGVNTVVYYYEQISATAPVYFLWDGSRNNFVVRATGQAYTVPNAGKMTTSGDDLFLLESFVDAQGRHVYVVYGFSWQGTLAAATFLNTYVRSHLSEFSNSWYIYEWKDASIGPSQNSFPDSGDQYNLLATG